MSKTKRYVVRKIQSNPKLFAIWDREEEGYVRFDPDDNESEFITSPYPFHLEQIKNRLRK